MIIYQNDFENSARMLAVRYLVIYWKRHPDITDGFGLSQRADLLNALLRRAFIPKASVKLMKRLKGRGHQFVDGENPTPRLTARRHINRTIASLAFTIEKAIERRGWQ